MFNIACNKRSAYLTINFIFFGFFQSISKVNLFISRGFGLTFNESCLLFGIAYSIAAIVRCFSGIFIDLIGHRNIPYVLLCSVTSALVALITLAAIFFKTKQDHVPIDFVNICIGNQDSKSCLIMWRINNFKILWQNIFSVQFQKKIQFKGFKVHQGSKNFGFLN